MGIPWFLKPDWMLHGEMLEEQERLAAEADSRERSTEKKLNELSRRVTELEDQLLTLEALLAEKEILPPRPEKPDEPEKPAKEAVTFPCRTTEPIICPVCGRRQQGNRDACYACKTPFHYET